MMNTETKKLTEMIKSSLALLQIQSIVHEFSHTTLIYCRHPGGASFDIEIHSNGLITLWSFLASDVPKNTAERFIRREPYQDSDAEVGFCVAEEQFLLFFSRKRYDFYHPATLQVLRQIALYTVLLCHVKEACDGLKKIL